MPRRAAPGSRDLFGKRVRAVATVLEDPIHVTILAYLRATLPADFYVMHTPNGGQLKSERRRQVRLGAVPGWPDLSIYGYGADEVPFVGFLEVKSDTGRTSSDQDDVHEGLEHLGFPVRVVRSIEDAREAVRLWRLPTIDVTARTRDEPSQAHPHAPSDRGPGGIRPGRT